jgi:hypothetical protein
VRARLLAAMVAIALLSVALTGLLLTRAADSELRDFSRRDLRFSAANAAEMAAAVYVEGGGWSVRSAHAVREVARSRGDTVALLGLDGRPLAGTLPPDRGRAVWAPVRVEGHRVGAIVASHPARRGVGGAAARLDRRLSGRT